MPKNIVILSDGTGQEGGNGTNTNVYRLFNIVLDRSPEQVAFYDRGLGTGWRKVTGNIGGMGISRNIKQCYEFIFDNFQSGDQIYLFGFSRGAATVRSLSAFIELFGILPKSRPELIKKAYRIYRKGKWKSNWKWRSQKTVDEERQKRKDRATEFVERHHTQWTRVKFLGVWDTVAALGLPIKSLDVVVDWIPFWKHHFHDFQLSIGVDHAVQALAIDDERKTFHPVLWEPEIQANQTMEQVWFCGMHTDVGGGYREAGLSDIALEWMVQKAVKAGLKIFPRDKKWWTSKPIGGTRIRGCAPNPDGTMHDSRKGIIGRIYRREIRSWPAEKYGKPTVHESALLRTRNRHNEAEPPYAPWILNGEHEVEPWVHPAQWGYAPEGLKDWCTPVEPQLGQNEGSSQPAYEATLGS